MTLDSAPSYHSSPNRRAGRSGIFRLPPPRRALRGRAAGLSAAVALALALVLAAGPAPATVWASVPVGAWPLRPQPTVARGFDPPTEPWGAGHRGVDLVGRPGQPVRAALPGRVSWAGVLAGRGVVVVDHGVTRTTYEPVDDRVPVGTTVAAGSPIGRLGAFGSHCAPRSCLHWGWLRGDTYLDPLQLVGFGPVRLLPLWRPEPVDPIAPIAYVGWRPAPPGPPSLIQARGCACW